MSKNEDAAASALEAAGLMISRPGDGVEESGLKWSWGVCTGSHGGHAKTLRVAMKRCAKCCEIHRFWKLGYNGKTQLAEPPFLRTVFRRVSTKHLGGWPYDI